MQDAQTFKLASMVHRLLSQTSEWLVSDPMRPSYAWLVGAARNSTGAPLLRLAKD